MWWFYGWYPYVGLPTCLTLVTPAAPVVTVALAGSTTVTTAFVVPAAGSTVTVTVAAANVFAAGNVVFIPVLNVGWLVVSAVVDAVTLTLRNPVTEVRTGKAATPATAVIAGTQIMLSPEFATT